MENSSLSVEERNTFRKKIRRANSAFFFVSGFGYATWASRIPSLQQQLKLNEAELGAVLFALPLGLLLTMPLTAKLLAKHSNNKIMMWGALFFNLVLCLPGFTHTIWQLVVVLLCFGASRNLLNISMNAHSVGVQKFYTKSIMTTFHGIWSLAGFAGAGLGYLMVSNHITPAYHLPLVGIALTVVSIYFYPSTLYQQPIKEKRKPMFSLPDQSVLKYALICFACMACENIMYDWSIIYFEKATLSLSSVAITAFVIYMISMTIGRLTGDKIVNAFGIVNILKYSGLMIFAGLFISVIFPVSYVVFIGFSLVGLGVSCIVPLIFSLAGKNNKNSGLAVASISTVGYLGFLVVPPLVGFLAHLTSLRWAFGVFSLLGLLIFFMSLKIKEEES